MAGQTNGWQEWGKYVLKELDRLNECDTERGKEIRDNQIDIATIKAKAFGWGGIGGLITGVIASLIAQALTK